MTDGGPDWIEYIDALSTAQCSWQGLQHQWAYAARTSTTHRHMSHVSPITSGEDG